METFTIEHVQTISYGNEGKPQEGLSVSVRIFYEALASGWLRDNFSGRGGGTDFMVLLAIALHARPLRGDDLDLLVSLGVASPEDEGRLYARVTDVGLADELGFSDRETIAMAAQRLKRRGLIDIYPLPPDFRDSRGRFQGSKAYVISGDLNRFLSKEVSEGRPHRAGSTRTVGADLRHRAGLTRTVNGDFESHRAGSTPENRGQTRTNIVEEAEAAEEASPPLTPPTDVSAVWQRFAARKGDPDFEPTHRDRLRLREILAEGYSVEQILAGIDLAFDTRPSTAKPVRGFGYVMRYIRRRPPTGQPAGASLTEGQTLIEGQTPIHEPTLAEEPTLTGGQPAGTVAGVSSADDVGLTGVLYLYTEANGREPTSSEKRRLGELVRRYTAEAVAKAIDECVDSGSARHGYLAIKPIRSVLERWEKSKSGLRKRERRNREPREKSSVATDRESSSRWQPDVG